MSNRYILFQAYGTADILAECRFALLQLIQHQNTSLFCLVLYTDNPNYFSEELKAFPHKVIEPVNALIIQNWRGGIDFVHRVKIKMLQHFFTTNTGSVIYCDTDTFCIQSLEQIFIKIENNTVYMHTNEGIISTTNSIVAKKWLHFLKKNSATVNGYNLLEGKDISMWNAGVIGINSNSAYLLNDVLAITDKIYPEFPRHTVEQFAFSFVLQKHNTIQEAMAYVFHYWNLKEYRILLKNYFLSNSKKNVQQLTKELENYPPQKILNDKIAYKKLTFFKKLMKKKWSINQYFTIE